MVIHSDLVEKNIIDYPLIFRVITIFKKKNSNPILKIIINPNGHGFIVYQLRNW